MNSAEPLEQSSPTAAGRNMPLTATEEGATGPTEQHQDTEMVDRDQGHSQPAEAAAVEEAAVEEAAAADAAEAPATTTPAWGQKHPLPAPVAVSRPAAQLPTTSPSSDSDTGPSKSGPKRKQVFPKTRASERCGKCENCLNPQRKKACMEVRRRQEEMLKQQQQHGGAAAQQQRGGSTASSAAARAAAVPVAKPAAASSAAPSDPFTQKVQAILAPNGGVRDTKHVSTLLQLLQSAKGMPQRITLLAVLQRSTPEVLAAAVRGRALLALQAWLTEFVAAQKSGPAGKVLNCLDKLPITTAALKAPCELGKVVGRLRKEESLDAATKEQAKALVAKWKHIVENESNREPAAGTAAKTQPAAANHAAAAKPAAGSAASSKPAAATAKPAAAAKPAAFAAVGDDDMFGAADKQRASLKEAAAKEAAAKEAAAQRHKVIRLEVDVPRGRAGASAADQPASPSGAASDAGKAPGTTAGVSSASKSPFEGLGAFTAGVSMIGGATGNLTLLRVGAVHQSAAERAAAAARRVPSPEPSGEPRKEKRKKVVWVDDGALAAVRWFYKVEPPAAAKKDADLSQAPGEASGSEPEREASPPGFETAAKREHLSEAQVLRAHRLQEDEERHELEERLVQMVASLAWYDTPAMAAASGAAWMEYGVARGEESSEVAVQAARQAQCAPVVYSSQAAIPPTPEEPQNPADAGLIMSPAIIPRIPLSLEEAAALQDQQHHHMQPMQQPQPAMQAGVGPGPGLQALPQQQGMAMGGQPQPQVQQQQFVGVPGGQGMVMQGGQLLMPQAQPMQQGGMMAASLPMSLPQQPQQQLGIAGGAQPGGQMPMQLNTDALAHLASSGLLLLPQQAPAQQQQLPQQPQAVGSMGLVMPQQPGAQVQFMQLGPGQQMQLGPGQLAGPALPQPQRQEQQAWQQQQQSSQQQGHSQAPQQQQQQWQPQQRQPQQQGGQGPQRGGYQGQQQPPRRPPQQQEGPPRGGGRPNIPCKFFNQPGGCRKGDSCGFAHIPRQGVALKRGRGDDDGGAGRPGGNQYNKQPRTWDNRGPRGGH